MRAEPTTNRLLAFHQHDRRLCEAKGDLRQPVSPFWHKVAGKSFGYIEWYKALKKFDSWPKRCTEFFAWLFLASNVQKISGHNFIQELKNG